MEEIILNPNFWDCECGDNFIHSKTQARCRKCGAVREDQPDSRENEVRQWFAFKKYGRRPIAGPFVMLAEAVKHGQRVGHICRYCGKFAGALPICGSCADRQAELRVATEGVLS